MGLLYKKVQIDGKVFDLIANVRKKASGKFVYSIQLNKDKNTEADPPENHTKKGGVNGAQTASTNSIPANSTKVNRQNSLKTADLLSPDYGKVADTPSQSTTPTARPVREPLGNEAPGLDTYFNDIEERAQVIQDKCVLISSGHTTPLMQENIITASGGCLLSVFTESVHFNKQIILFQVRGFLL